MFRCDDQLMQRGRKLNEANSRLLYYSLMTSFQLRIEPFKHFMWDTLDQDLNPTEKRVANGKIPRVASTKCK